MTVNFPKWGFTMPEFADAIYNNPAIGRPVADSTGLQGAYAFTLNYDPNGGNGPDIFTALTEELGLKLVSATGPVKFFIIDHIEQPPAN